MNISKLKTIFLLTAIATALAGCEKKDYPLSYGQLDSNANYNIDSEAVPNEIPLFANDLCVADADVLIENEEKPEVSSAGIYDLTNMDVLYSLNANEKVAPASLTKIMTAILVLENGNLDDVVTVPNITFNEDGVQTFGLKEGEKISVRNLLNVLLIYSGNDAAVALADYVAGSEGDFVTMMNERAKQLGATNTNFVNCHGLSNENHYTTAYDLYLMFNEAIKHEEFVSIINTSSYTVSYTKATGEATERVISSTNKFITGDYQNPDCVCVIGGKTGTTQAAGRCLIVLSKDSSDKPYIGVIMGAAKEDALYNLMIKLFNDTIG